MIPLVSQVLKTPGLYLVTLERSIWMHLYLISKIRLQPEFGRKPGFQFFGRRTGTFHQFHFEQNVVYVTSFFHNHFVFVAKPRNGTHHVLYGRRGQQHTFHFGYVISPADNSAGNDTIGPTTVTLLIAEFYYVFGVEPYARLTDSVQGSDYQFAAVAWLGNGLAGIEVLDLRQEHRFIYVQPTRLGRAFESPSPNFRGAGVIEYLRAPCLFHALLG